MRLMRLAHNSYHRVAHKVAFSALQAQFSEGAQKRRARQGRRIDRTSQRERERKLDFVRKSREGGAPLTTREEYEGRDESAANVPRGEKPRAEGCEALPEAPEPFFFLT